MDDRVDSKKQSKLEYTVEQIRNKATQKMLPGEKLVNEIQLAHEMGVSRTTLREAIRILTLQGILEVQHGRGTFVAKDRMIQGHSIELTSNNETALKDLFEMRLIIEPQIAALACSRATDEEIQAICIQGEKVRSKIREVQKNQLKAKKSGIESQLEESMEVSWEEEDKQFHDLIAKAAHNKLTDQFFPWIHDAIQRAVKRGIHKKELSDNTIRDHYLIMEFLKKRDSIAARNAMEIHIHNGILTLGLNKDEDEPIF